MKTKAIIVKSIFALACILSFASCKPETEIVIQKDTDTVIIKEEEPKPKAVTLLADIPAGSTRTLSADTVTH